MRYLQNVELDYRTLDRDENLYDDVDLTKEDCVDAQYWLANGYPGNPDICALPRPASVEEMRVNNCIPISGYRANQIKEMPVHERKRSLFLLKQLRYPFPFHSQIEAYLSMALLSSYSARRIGITELSREVRMSGRQSDSRMLSCMDAVSANVLGFSIVGTSGTGKSTAFELACRKYPKAIMHNFEDGFYIQIPLIRLTAFANSNLTALFLSFARQLDRILDTGNDHLDMIQGKSNLGRIVSTVCMWIEQYHIGAIVIDEIQFLDFNSKSAKSFENFLTITADTGVALITIGTPDACREWGGMLRIQRRMGSMIVRADAYCKNKPYMETIIKKLWKYQWLDDQAELTPDIIDTMYEESLGSIDMLTTLWMIVQFEALSRKKQPIIDSDFIRKVSKEKYKEMKELLQAEMTGSEQIFLDLRESLMNGIRSSANADEERYISENLRLEAAENIAEHYDRDFVLGEVIDTIQCCNPEISELRIRKAFAKAEKEDGFKKLKKQERIGRVLAVIRKAESGKKKADRPVKTPADANRIEKLEDALKESLFMAGEGGNHAANMSETYGG